MSIPSMGGQEIAPFLRDAAGSLEGLGAVVECGSWLGAATAPLAKGLSEAGLNVGLHCYDRWEANASEAKKAQRQGANVEPGQDLLPLFLDNVEHLYPYIVLHKGDTLEARWSYGHPIELYVDDASKGPLWFDNAMRTFGPSFIPGKTVLVLMDYQFYQSRGNRLDRARYACQRDFIEANGDAFELVEDLPDTSGVAFRYLGGVDWDGRILQTRFQRLLKRSRVARWVLGVLPLS